MASQTASISIGVVLANSSRKNGSATATITTGALQQPQNYSGGTGVAKSAGNIKLQMPQTLTIGTLAEDGKTVNLTPIWFKFLSLLFNERLGGPQGASIPDLSTSVVTTRAQAVTATNAVALVGQQVNANAQSLGAVVQVAQTNSLSGATQIPPVVYSSKPGQMQR